MQSGVRARTKRIGAAAGDAQREETCACERRKAADGVSQPTRHVDMIVGARQGSGSSCSRSSGGVSAVILTISRVLIHCKGVSTDRHEHSVKSILVDAALVTRLRLPDDSSHPRRPIALGTAYRRKTGAQFRIGVEHERNDSNSHRDDTTFPDVIRGSSSRDAELGALLDPSGESLRANAPPVAARFTQLNARVGSDRRDETRALARIGANHDPVARDRADPPR